MIESTKPIIVVSGLPRSGTSLLMQMLAAGGAEILEDGSRPPDLSNPRGYFELSAVKALASGQPTPWLDEARGKAVKVISPLLRFLPIHGSLRFRVVLVERKLTEVLASQRAMLVRSGQRWDPGHDAKLAHLFEQDLAKVGEWAAASPQVSLLRVSFNELVNEPKPVVENLVRFVGLDLDGDAMARAIDQGLYRQRR